MFRYIAYRWKLSEHLRSLSRKNAKLKRAQESNGTNDLDDEITELMYEAVATQEKILRLTTDRLWEQAAKLIVPVPSGDRYWDEPLGGGELRHLNEEGVMELRRRIREERNDRFRITFALMSVFTGLIGAATGLVAVIAG